MGLAGREVPQEQVLAGAARRSSSSSPPRGGRCRAAVEPLVAAEASQDVSQLQLAFLRFHNAVVPDVRPELGPGVTDDEVFAEAQRTVRWHTSG